MTDKDLNFNISKLFQLHSLSKFYLIGIVKLWVGVLPDTFINSAKNSLQQLYNVNFVRIPIVLHYKTESSRELVFQFHTMGDHTHTMGDHGNGVFKLHSSNLGKNNGFKIYNCLILRTFFGFLYFQTKILTVSNMDCWSVSNSFMWNIESLAKCPTIKYTTFGCKNISKFFDYQILANRFVLKLKMCRNVSFFLLIFY